MQCPGRFLGIIGRDPSSVSKSNRLHVKIFWFSFISLRYNKGIVKTTTPFVNATTLVICSHVIWDFTRDVGVSEIKVISWRAGRGPLYEPFMAGEGLYYTRDILFHLHYTEYYISMGHAFIIVEPY